MPIENILQHCCSTIDEKPAQLVSICLLSWAGQWGRCCSRHLANWMRKKTFIRGNSFLTCVGKKGKTWVIPQRLTRSVLHVFASFVCYFIFMITRPWNYKDEVTRKGSLRIRLIVYKLEICESINRSSIFIKTYTQYPKHPLSMLFSLYTSLIFSMKVDALSWLWLSKRMSRTRAFEVRLTEFRFTGL